jgi:hypothetical protein
MPSSTPQRGFPFPVDTDLIDVAGDVRRLANAVDTDNQLIVNDYASRDIYFRVIMNALGVSRETGIHLQSGFGIYTTTGFSTFVVALPQAYSGKYYAPIVTIASQSPHYVHALEPGYQTPSSFTAHVRDMASGAGAGAGHVIAIWWTTIGIN